MAILDRIRNFFLSPADRRVAEAWADAASPRAASPFAPGPQSPAVTPPIAWGTDGAEPPPRVFTVQPGYTDHTYKAMSAPVGFEGWSLGRIRGAIAQHRIGIFWESSLLLVAILGFAPVLAALQQAIAPIFDLDRYIRGGEKGLARMVREDLEEALVPRAGLLPSPYLPPDIWGTMMIYLRIMGFAVLQHVDGEPDPDTQIRPRFTRLWPPWAVRYERTIGKWFAYTSEGIVEIKNDGKFTLVCDEQEPHFTGAIVAISEEVLSGRLIQQLRNSWFFKYGNPKWIAMLPDKVATESNAGRAFFASVQTITGPDGVGALPYGSDFKTVGLDSKASNSFGQGLQSVILHIAMVIVGGSGTGIDGSESGGEGFYKPQKGGQWTVRHDLIARPLKAIVRALNGGHIAPYVDINHGAAIASAKRSGTWVYPTLDIPLPKPDQETRIAAYAGRIKLAIEIVAAAHEEGVAVTSEWLARLCERLEIDPLALASEAGPPIYAWEAEQKLFAPDEIRARKGAPPLPDGMGSLEQLAKERAAGGDKAGAIGQVAAAEVKVEPGAAPGGEPATPDGEGPATQRSARP